MRSAIFLTAGMALLLVGCDLGTAGGNASASRVDDAASDADRSAKLGSYSGPLSSSTSYTGFNPIRDLNRYEAMRISTAKPDTEVSLFPTFIEQAVSDLKQARARPGDLPGLDAAAGRAIPVLERLLARVRGLDSYYTTRGQLIDGLARGRREDPLLIADYRSAIAVWTPLKTAYEAARDEQLVRDVEAARRVGRMDDYYDISAVQKAAALARAIDTPQAAQEPQRAATADRIVSEMLPLIERGRRAHAARDANPDTRGMDNGVLSNMEMMIGAWRELRRAPDADHHEKMIAPFEAAMQSVIMS